MTPAMKFNRLATFVGVAAMSVGCKPPPDAPERFEELCDYIFGHTDDEEQDAVIAGLENLNVWMEKSGNLESTAEGYTISKLSQESVGDLKFDTNRTPDVSSLIGAAVAVRHDLSMKKVAQTTVVDNWEEVAEGNYDEYNRNFGNQNPSCFPGRNCESLTATSFSKSKWAGLVVLLRRNGRVVHGPAQLAHRARHRRPRPLQHRGPSAVLPRRHLEGQRQDSTDDGHLDGRRVRRNSCER